MLKILCVLALGCALGCGASADKPKLTAVKGLVTLDGKPLPEWEIFFVLSGQAPTTLAVKDGAYSGMANVGNNAVEIRSYKAGPVLIANQPATKVNVIPARYSDLSKLKAEVADSGANDFKFVITSK